MDEKTIREKIANYRDSRLEWLRRRDECTAKAHACDGAIEALEGLLQPAVPIEDMIHLADGGE